MNVLLDTHIWLWWVNQNEQLPIQHQAIIAEAENVYISSISCWELAMLQQPRTAYVGLRNETQHFM